MANVELVIGKERIRVTYLPASGDILGGAESDETERQPVKGSTPPKAPLIDEPPPFIPVYHSV